MRQMFRNSRAPKLSSRPPSVARVGLVTCAAVAASAVAFALYARAAWPWAVMGFIGLVPWLAALDRTTSLRGAVASAVVMSVAFVLAVFGWFATSIQAYTGAPWFVSLLVLVLLAPVIQPQFIPFAVARGLGARGAGGATGFWRRAIVGSSIYVGSEWAIPKLFGDTLGQGLYASLWMRQAADLAGTHGLTCMLIVANESVLGLLQTFRADRGAASPFIRLSARQAFTALACVAATLLALLGHGAVRCRQFARPTRSDDAVTVGVVQADISQYDRLRHELGTFETVRRILNTHFMLSTRALRQGHVDLLVWPETVYPTTFGTPKSSAGAAFDREIGGFVETTDTPLIFGAYDAQGTSEFNAAVFLEPAPHGRVTFDTYRKESLFPLTERVPTLLDSKRIRRWLPWLGTWQPGHGPQVLPLMLRDGRTLRVAPLICYDAVDPRHAIAAVRQGADLIVTLSNDSWFATGPAPRLHLIVSAFRSIETRRPQVRATNTGISAFISPTGEVLTKLGVDKRGILVGTLVPERRAKTLMLAWGDWFGPTALASGLALLLASTLRRGARSGTDPSPLP